MIISDKTFSKRNLVIEENIMNYFRNIILAHDFSVETGGIIVGEMRPLDESIVITDVSAPFEKDSRDRFHFNRKSDGHQEYMDKLWKESGLKKMYLGEWHTHDQKIPVPSSIDINNWKKIEQRNKVAPEMYFIIIGTQRMEIWNAFNGKIVQMNIGDIMS